MKFKREYVFLSLIIIVSFIPYSNIFENEFVWDDLDFILGESHGTTFLDYFIFPSMHGLYRPVRGMAFDFMKDSFGEGLFFYHLLSIILHIICSVLIYLISKKLLSRDLSALLSSLIFAVHPIHTARVTNMTASFDLIGIALILLSFYIYISNTGLNRLKFSLPLFLLALFSSEEALILPLLIFAYLLIYGFDKKKHADLFLFFSVSSLFFILRTFVLGGVSRISSGFFQPFFVRIISVPIILLVYIKNLVFPITQSICNTTDYIKTPFSPVFIISFFSIILLSSVFFIFLEKTRTVYFRFHGF